jgi:hypothetical protein
MAGSRIARANEGGRQTQPRQLIRTRIRYWPLADMSLAAVNVGFGGKADIAIDRPECPLMTQSGHT